MRDFFNKRRSFWLSFAVLCMLVMGIVLLNIHVVRMASSSSAMSEGQLQLTSITNDIESRFYQAECTVESLSNELEVYIANGLADNELFRDFADKKTKYFSERLDGAEFFVYISQNGRLYTAETEISADQPTVYTTASDGGVCFTAPYINENTGKMCYSAYKTLSDGETVLGINYYIDDLRRSIKDIGRSSNSICMIVNEDGVIVDHTDTANIGQDYSVLSYSDIVRKVFSLYGKYFVYDANGEKYSVFSDKTSYGWYLIVCVDVDQAISDSANDLRWIMLLIIILFAALIIAYINSYYIKVRSTRKEMQLDQIAEKMSSALDLLTDEEKEALLQKPGKENSSKAVKTDNRLSFRFIVMILVFMGAAMIISNSYTHFRSVNAKMKGEASECYSHVNEWITENKMLVNMLANTFSIHPDLIYDYDECVKHLDDIVQRYDETSAAYIVNPEWEQPVIMNSGRGSADAKADAAESKWYRATIESKNENGFNISKPYLDELAGGYCITLSQRVYDRSGGQIGVLAIDYYADKLISILGESYTDDGYAFLVDSDYRIINHPCSEYQISPTSYKNAGTLCYRKVLSSDRAVMITDYDGKKKMCTMYEDKTFGMSVIFVKSLSATYYNLIASDSIIMFTFILCITIILSIMQNLSRMQKQVHKELMEAAESARAASQEKNDFLANMSHEIRTPMNAVIGMTELILRESDISDAVREYCCSIKNSSKNLISLINDILDFSKIESGKLDINEEEFNIASTLNDITNMAVIRIDKKPLKFIAKLDPTIPAVLIGDEIRIRQVIINLVSNAVKYSKEGCVILNVWQEREDEKFILNVSVKDTGIGIAPENIGKLFNKFQQLDTKKNRNVEGTGLGLAISKHLVERMGGTMGVTSTYGKGSEFSFRLPLVTADDKPFLEVREADKVHALIYADLGLYKMEEVRSNLSETYEGLGKCLNIDLECCYSPDELKKRMKQKKYTHVITGITEYMSDKSLFSDISGLIIVQKRSSEAVELSNVTTIFEPLSAMTLTAVLNDEALTTDEDEVFVTRFVAPSAKVLIVDDSCVNLQVAAGLMKPYRMKITTADSAKSAINLLRNMEFDIIFMDHMMPEIDGVEATKIIRSIENGYYKNVPIIALTANAVTGVREEFIAAGMNDFLAKPIELMSLDKILRKWLPTALIHDTEAESGASLATVKPPEGNALFDPKTGLFYAGGSEDVYRTVLNSYINQAVAKQYLLSNLCTEKLWKRYITEVHALKSTSLTIGAKSLSTLAKSLETAGKKGDYKKIEEKNKELIELYEKVVAEAEKYLFAAAEAPSDDSELTETTAENIKAWIEQILAACNDFNEAGIKNVCLEAFGYTYGGVPLKTLFDEVKSSAEEFEFDEAENKTHKIYDKFFK